MPELTIQDTLVRRLVAATRAVSLYSRGSGGRGAGAAHPLVERNASALFESCSAFLKDAPAVVVGFLDGEVIVDGTRAHKAGPAAHGLARSLSLAGVEKISFERGLTRDELRATIEIFSDARPSGSLETMAARLAHASVRHVTVSAITVEDADGFPPGLEGAMRAYDSAMRAAESFWESARAGGQPSTADARKVVNSLAQVVTDDRSSVMALTTLKRHDAYTFTHMVNVSVLTMALARAIGVEAGLVRECGLAALMHDIGKSRTPLEVLNKPGRLSAEEMRIMQRHVIDGAELLWSLDDMPRLAAVVAFEHHLRNDFAGYPEGAERRPLNLCTMIVCIADVFDALRTNRPYRKGLATDRVRDLLAEQNGTAFEPKLLKKFIAVVGLFPVGSLVRLDNGAVGVVTHEHPEDPFRPQVKVVLDPAGDKVDEPYLVNTWERDVPGTPGIAEAIEADEVGLDPLTLL